MAITKKRKHMEIKRKITKEVEEHDGYQCDLCGVYMDNDYSTLFASSVIKTEGAYSLNTDYEKNWDLKEEEVMEQSHFCQDCYIKLTNHIMQEGGKINEI